MPFPDFSRTRLFQPLGMTHTSWRDDYTRIVKGRAMAYNSNADGYHTLMPFENVYGNGGLLTEQLAQLAGTYTSDDAEMTMTAAVEEGGLVLKHRPDVTIKLTPMYADAFRAGQLGTVIFRRDASGRATTHEARR